MPTMKDIKDFSREQLENLFKLKDSQGNQGYQGFRAGQVFNWVHRKCVPSFGDMTNLPKTLRDELSADFTVSGCSVREISDSKEGTCKLLLELQDGQLIESVLIPVMETPFRQRVTGCVSSQAGCRFGCRFCASGLGGFSRNLSCGEIVEQVIHLKRQAPEEKLTHVVVMGVGEPFDNYEPVINALKILNDPEGLNIGARRLTVSTCGVVSGIRKLGAENLQIELSVSLHAPDNKTRNRLMPVNKCYPLKRLMGACRHYVKTTGRQITFEYVLIRDINAAIGQAKTLARLLKGLNCKVNLIPFNRVKEFDFRPPSRSGVRVFSETLKKAGIKNTVRQSRGKNIAAACGQLRFSKTD